MRKKATIRIMNDTNRHRQQQKMETLCTESSRNVAAPCPKERPESPRGGCFTNHGTKAEGTKISCRFCIRKVKGNSSTHTHTLTYAAPEVALRLPVTSEMCSSSVRPRCPLVQVVLIQPGIRSRQIIEYLVALSANRRPKTGSLLGRFLVD